MEHSACELPRSERDGGAIARLSPAEREPQLGRGLGESVPSLIDSSMFEVL